MDEAQSICLEACILQSWWEFAVDCAIHVYNCTPIQPYSWKMLVENLKHTKPDVTHFHVFGCGVYVFLPEEVCHSKLNPKSELMTFLEYPQGTKGYFFMRGPNNVLFYAVQALFNKTLYPKCPDMCCPEYTPVADLPVGQQGEYNVPPDDDENDDYGGGFDLNDQPPVPPMGQHGRAPLQPPAGHKLSAWQQPPQPNPSDLHDPTPPHTRTLHSPTCSARNS